METASDTRTTTARLFGILSVLYAATFFLGSAAHLGSEIPLGFATIDEPRIIPATIVEGLCGIALLVGAYGIFTRKPWAWVSAVGAHAFSIGGVLLGITAQAAGGGGTDLNTTYHIVILTALVATLALLLTRGPRAALGHDGT